METPLFNLDHRHGWTPASYLHRFLTLACALKGSSWGNLGEATTPSKILSPHAPEEKVFGSTPRSTMTGARLQLLAARTPHALASPLTLVARSGAAPVEWHGERRARSSLDLPLGDRRWRCDRSRQGESQQRQVSNGWRISDGSVGRLPHHHAKYIQCKREEDPISSRFYYNFNLVLNISFLIPSVVVVVASFFQQGCRSRGGDADPAIPARPGGAASCTP